VTTPRRLRARLEEPTRLVAMAACQSDSLVMRQLAMLAFANEIAHDVRNPLNAAKLQLQLLERRTRHLDEPSLRESIEIVARELARLSQLLDEVLEFIHPLECAVSAIAERDGVIDAP